jgi:hypothetical protein
MDEKEIAAIEARAAAATPGPWNRIKSLGSRFWTLGTIRSHTAHPLPERNEDADWSFVEHARSDIPSLCQALRESRKALERMAQERKRLVTSVEKNLADFADGFRDGMKESGRTSMRMAEALEMLRELQVSIPAALRGTP